ncbi:MAG TPA: LysM peptidoglycan-binding domain-containing protein, partial [Chloroflexota bacterium]|nr:LysM peptidoglycan-binding domain-containing protein [Chloroflexota bacterium]
DPGIPSILLETGFLSNQAEAGKLATPAYQQTVASAIADGFASFFSSGDASGTPSAPAHALGGCGGQAPAAPQPAVRWLQTFLPTGLLSGTDPHAQTFAELAPFTYLKLVGQSGNFYEVINPKTSGPGFVDATKVGPSGPPPAFTPFWVENFKPVSLLSGAGAGAVSFGTLPPWNFFQVVAPSTGSRFYAKVGTTGNVAYVDRASVGPSGPPPPPGSTAAPATTAGPAIPAPAPATKQIQVAAGDTLFAISQRVGVNVSDLIAANHLSAAGAIQAGQTLLIPGGQVEAAPAPAAPKTVVIRPGDTLLKIANAAGTSVAAILKLNNLADPNAIVAGNTLIVG